MWHKPGLRRSLAPPGRARWTRWDERWRRWVWAWPWRRSATARPAPCQGSRHSAMPKIEPASNGGFFVQVTVFRELEDLPRPTRATAGATFRNYQTIERQFWVIDPTVFESGWIPRGRDLGIEQAIL